MKIKELFTVPEGQKVTEKVFHRVLISSICSILLCMSCLVSTTWAWFTVSIENQGNEIQIVDFEVSVTQNGVEIAEENGVYSLAAGTYSIDATVKRDALAGVTLKSQEPYVVMTVKIGEQTTAYSNMAALCAADLKFKKDTVVSFKVQWGEPVGTIPWISDTQAIGEAPAAPAESSDNSESSTPVETTNPPAGEEVGATPDTVTETTTSPVVDTMAETTAASETTEPTLEQTEEAAEGEN